VEVTNFHRATMILDKGINSCSLYHYTVQGIFAIQISSSRALFTHSFDHVFELHCPWISFPHISKGQTNMNLIIIHFNRVSKVENGHIYIYVATLNSNSVYVHLDGRRVYYIHSVFCLTTGPKPPPKRCLHIAWSRASSFKWEYPLLSLRSSSSFLRLLPRLLATSVYYNGP